MVSKLFEDASGHSTYVAYVLISPFTFTLHSMMYSHHRRAIAAGIRYGKGRLKCFIDTVKQLD